MNWKSVWKMWRHLFILLLLQLAFAAPIPPDEKQGYYVTKEINTLGRAIIYHFIELLESIISDDSDYSDSPIFEVYSKMIVHLKQIDDSQNAMYVFGNLAEILDLIDSLESAELESLFSNILIQYDIGAFEQKENLQSHVEPYMNILHGDKSVNSLKAFIALAVNHIVIYD